MIGQPETPRSFSIVTIVNGVDCIIPLGAVEEEKKKKIIFSGTKKIKFKYYTYNYIHTLTFTVTTTNITLHSGYLRREDAITLNDFR